MAVCESVGTWGCVLAFLSGSLEAFLQNMPGSPDIKSEDHYKAGHTPGRLDWWKRISCDKKHNLLNSQDSTGLTTPIVKPLHLMFGGPWSRSERFRQRSGESAQEIGTEVLTDIRPDIKFCASCCPVDLGPTRCWFAGMNWFIWRISQLFQTVSCFKIYVQ